MKLISRCEEILKEYEEVLGVEPGGLEKVREYERELLNAEIEMLKEVFNIDEEKAIEMYLKNRYNISIESLDAEIERLGKKISRQLKEKKAI